jgi:hypothetical protein
MRPSGTTQTAPLTPVLLLTVTRTHRRWRSVVEIESVQQTHDMAITVSTPNFKENPEAYRLPSSPDRMNPVAAGADGAFTGFVHGLMTRAFSPSVSTGTSE